MSQDSVTGNRVMEMLRGLVRRRPFRFVTVGVAAAMLLFLLSWLLVRLGLPPFAGSFLAYAAAFAAAYLAHRSWTFEGRHGHGHALPRYLALQTGCAAFSGLVSHFSVTRLGLSPLAMAMVTTGAASAASYFASSLWVFSGRGMDASDPEPS